MYQCIVHAGAVTQVDRELEHGETITHDVLSEKGGIFALLDGFCRQVVKY
jgi:hypothetical protein